MMEEFKEFAERLKAIGRQAYYEYRPIVNSFIASQSTEQNEIDHIWIDFWIFVLTQIVYCFSKKCVGIIGS